MTFKSSLFATLVIAGVVGLASTLGAAAQTQPSTGGGGAGSAVPGGSSVPGGPGGSSGSNLQLPNGCATPGSTAPQQPCRLPFFQKAADCTCQNEVRVIKGVRYVVSNCKPTTKKVPQSDCRDPAIVRRIAS